MEKITNQKKDQLECMNIQIRFTNENRLLALRLMAEARKPIYLK